MAVVATVAMASSPALYGAKKGAAPTGTANQATEERYENLGLFQKVLFFVEQNYVEDVNNKKLIYGALKGMVETLDPHSSFLPPEVFRDMKIDTSGRFGGVGIELGLKNSQLTVITPIDDTPAYEAGIKAGDRIVKINGESTKGLGLEEAVAKMRGKKGSDIALTIWRKGLKEPKEYKITRAEIKIKTVKSEVLEKDYLYARLTNFNERSSHDLRTAIENFEKSNRLRGLVLDLRNNPGGLLDQAVDVTSLFVEDGAVVTMAGKDKSKGETKYVKKGFARKDFAVAVLVNGASASASEIVAGALQDHKRAVVLGQPTFGKGSVQNVVEIAPDVGLKLTIARYYTPNGRSIQMKGIHPDVLLEEFDQKTLAAAKKAVDYVREKDLKQAMNADGEDEVIEALVMEEKAEKEAKDKEVVFDAADRPVKAKDDYQVREALNYIKSARALIASGVSMGEPEVATALSKGAKTSEENPARQ